MTLSIRRNMLICLLILLSAVVARPQPADLVLRNAAVYTVDAACTRAKTIAIRGGKIIFVGTDREAAAHIGAGSLR